MLCLKGARQRGHTGRKRSRRVVRWEFLIEALFYLLIVNHQLRRKREEHIAQMQAQLSQKDEDLAKKDEDLAEALADKAAALADKADAFARIAALEAQIAAQSH